MIGRLRRWWAGFGPAERRALRLGALAVAVMLVLLAARAAGW